jgi:hypothetical protein
MADGKIRACKHLNPVIFEYGFNQGDRESARANILPQIRIVQVGSFNLQEGKSKSFLEEIFGSPKKKIEFKKEEPNFYIRKSLLQPICP